MRKILSLFLVIGTLGLAGCGDLTGLSSDIAGTYQLYSVDGERLPVLLADDGYTQEIVYSGELRMSSNGTFVETVEIEEREPGSTRYVTDRRTGTYSGSRSNMTLRYDGGGSINAEYTGRDIVLYNYGLEIVYTR